MNYKHYAPKTKYELWMLNNVTCHIEQNIIPQNWTANSVTVMGNLILYIIGPFVIYTQGVSYTREEPCPSWVFYLAAFGL